MVKAKAKKADPLAARLQRAEKEVKRLERERELDGVRMEDEWKGRLEKEKKEAREAGWKACVKDNLEKDDVVRSLRRELETLKQENAKLKARNERHHKAQEAWQDTQDEMFTLRERVRVLTVERNNLAVQVNGKVQAEAPPSPGSVTLTRQEADYVQEVMQNGEPSSFGIESMIPPGFEMVIRRQTP